MPSEKGTVDAVVPTAQHKRLCHLLNVRKLYAPVVSLKSFVCSRYIYYHGSH